ncbi:MAG: chorismate lyase [Oceanospirillaceae bacterium]
MPVKTALCAINFDTRWTTYRRPNSLQAPRIWRRWLCDRGSLTQHLIEASNQQFQVLLQQQDWLLPSRSEAKVLGIKHRQVSLIREVKLMGAGETFVFARTVIPAGTLTGKQKQLAMLGNRSLGSLLFTDPSMRRGKFQITQLQLDSGEKVWARRSVFYLSNKPLLVCEVFMPVLAELCYQPPVFPGEQ